MPMSHLVTLANLVLKRKKGKGTYSIKARKTTTQSFSIKRDRTDISLGKSSCSQTKQTLNINKRKKSGILDNIKMN